MKITCFPALRVDFFAQDGRPPRTVYRPLAAIELDELLEQAERENCYALLELGERFYFGTGVSQDYPKALEYLLRASAQEVQDAEFLVAECYRCGNGFPQDYEQYFVWIFRAAEHGSWMAMLNLAAAYAQGKGIYGGFGVDVDLSKSLEWSLEAEKAIRAYWDFYAMPTCVDMLEIKRRLLKAYVQTAMQLSEHYANGMGTKRDRSRAFYWLNCAKQFVSNATGLRDVPMIDNAISQMKARMDAELGKN